MSPKVQTWKANALIVIFLILLMGVVVSMCNVPPVVKGDPPFSENEQVNIENASFQWKPSIAVDSSGVIYVVWEDERNDDGDIYFSKSTDGGETWSPNVMVNDDTNDAEQRFPAIAFDSYGHISVVWEDKRNNNWDIYFTNSTDGGTTWTNPNVMVSNDTTNKSQRNPAIAVDSQGRIFVGWEDWRGAAPDIFFANSTDGGQTWKNPNVRVNDADLFAQYDPTIVVDSSDKIYLAWEDYRSGDDLDIYVTNSTDGGQSWIKPNLRVSTDTTITSQRNPSLAVDSSDNVFMAWEDERNGNADIYFSKSTNGGITWTDPNIKVETNANDKDQSTPSLAVDSSGTIYIAWQDNRRSPHIDIYFSKSLDGGTTWLESDVRINDDVAANPGAPALAVDNAGAVYVVWEDMRSGNFDIYFASITPKPFADMLSVEGFLEATPGIQHIIPNKPEFSFKYNDPRNNHIKRYNASVWDADGSTLLWYCNRTSSVSSGSMITVTYNTAPFPTNGAPLLDGTTYKLRVKVKNATEVWGPISEVEFHMNEVLAPVTPVSPLDDAIIEASSSQTVTWTSPGPDSEGDSPVSYDWQVSTDSTFTNIIASGTSSDNSSDAFSTTASTSYYWRVNLTDGWETSSYGNSPEGYWNFTTLPPSETNEPPTITNKEESPSTAEAGSPITHTFTAEDPDDETLTWSIVSGPEWLEIGPTNGTIYGIPSPEDKGVNKFTIRVTDEKGRNDTFEFTIDVSEPTEGDDQDGDDDISEVFSFMIPWLVLVILIIFLIILFIILKRRKRPEESEAPVKGAQR